MTQIKKHDMKEKSVRIPHPQWESYEVFMGYYECYWIVQGYFPDFH